MTQEGIRVSEKDLGILVAGDSAGGRLPSGWRGEQAGVCCCNRGAGESGAAGTARAGGCHAEKAKALASMRSCATSRRGRGQSSWGRCVGLSRSGSSVVCGMRTEAVPRGACALYLMKALAVWGAGESEGGSGSGSGFQYCVLTSGASPCCVLLVNRKMKERKTKGKGHGEQ